MIGRSLGLLTAVLVLIVLAGCHPNSQDNRTPSPLQIATAPAETEQASASPAPTAVLASAQTLNLEEEGDFISEPPPNVDPLEFVFPELDPETVSLWRPPLYPIPWEPSPSDHFYLARPIGANDINWPLARYRYGYLLYSEPHTGIDIPAPKGTPIMAAGPGTVIHAGYGLYFVSDIYKDPYGIAVAIKHDFGYRGKVLYTVYGHLDTVDVYRGQRVGGGEVIGTVGETGKVSGPHLHLEVRIGDNNYFSSRNPELWISPPLGWGVLVGRVVEASGRKMPQVKVRLVHKDTKRVFEVMTYAQGSVNSDEYYDENLVLGDIPAGKYLLYLDFKQQSVKTEIEILAGQVNYFSYRASRGFEFVRPTEDRPEFISPEISAPPSENTVETGP